MGSVAKAVKKVTKVIKRPVSKITKGIAKGIARVGKSVMRGVGKLQAKLGPLGSIALAVAMPYALSGLSSMTTGMMNYGLGTATPNTAFKLFVRSIGNVGNTIRTGYQAATGAISRTFSTITRSITEGFSSMGRGNNIFSRISRGAKNLFNNARATVQKFKPFTAKGGSVDVTGQFARGPASYGNEFMSHSMTNVQAQAALEAGAITGDQLVGQSWGKTGWLTKANPMDKAIAETINKTYETNTMPFFDGSTKKAFLEYKKGFDASGENYNYLNIDKAMKDNFIINKDSGSIGFDFNRSGDFTHHEATMRANPHLESGQSIQDARYTFNGEKTFSANGKKTLNKKVLKKMQGKALTNLRNNLLAKTDYVPTEIDYSLMGDMTQKTDGATSYGGTTIKGSSGGSLLEGVYNNDQKERILNYYRHMNIVGSTYT